ncbi:MAG: anti-sigma factor [Phycisphaerales bacterium]
MNGPHAHPVGRDDRERAIDLLADRAIDGLLDDEAIELDRLLVAHPELDDDTMDLAAASIAVAGLAASAEPMPGALRELVQRAGDRWFDAHAARGGAARRRNVSGEAPRRGDRGNAPAAAGARMERDAAEKMKLDDRGAASRGEVMGPRAESPRREGRSIAGTIGWVAAAAALALAALAWWPSIAARRSDAERCERLARSAKDLVSWRWTRGDNPLAAAGLDGDVLWSNERQEGFLRLKGLAANDPRTLQYQLWIFDATRDDRYPVDGGVFDIPPGGGDAIIPIHAALGVRSPVMFAVTVEPPGGVVVSRRDIVALAKPESAGK